MHGKPNIKICFMYVEVHMMCLNGTEKEYRMEGSVCQNAIICSLGPPSPFYQALSALCVCVTFIIGTCFSCLISRTR